MVHLCIRTCLYVEYKYSYDMYITPYGVHMYVCTEYNTILDYTRTRLCGGTPINHVLRMI